MTREEAAEIILSQRAYESCLVCKGFGHIVSDNHGNWTSACLKCGGTGKVWNEEHHRASTLLKLQSRK